jgi:hypothetical protein
MMSATNPLPLRGGGRGRGDAPLIQDQAAVLDVARSIDCAITTNVAVHPAPQPPPLKGRGR